MNKDTMKPTKKISPAVAALIIIVLVGIVTAATIVITIKNKSGQSAIMNPINGNAGSNSTPMTPNSTDIYKDGNYTAKGDYYTPGGRGTIALNITIKANLITDVSIKMGEAGGVSIQYQDAFNAAYKVSVVSKNVNNVSLSRVAGASLTTDGFNTVLEQIKSDAKA